MSDYFLQNYSEDEIFVPEKKNIFINFFPHHFHFIQKLYNYDKIKIVLAHCTYNDLKIMNVNTKHKITFLRDPIERVISHYYFFNYNETKIHLVDLSDDDFNEFCTFHGKLMCNSLGLLNKEGELLEYLIPERINEFSFIGCIETYDDDMIQLNQTLKQHFGFLNDVNFSVIKNKNNEKDTFKTFITEELRERIRPFCLKDYILYKYVFDKHHQPINIEYKNNINV
jgi:hypothetical protein